ncbi:MAG: GGDEF domain-containing protein [Betaproteobacteria bacterium]|nr:GGDEF domain-containing protein [Betaproteobacteria bacterium]
MDLVSHNEFVVEDFTPSTAVGKVLGNFAVPLGLWGIALLLAGHATLPDYLSGLKIHGPYLVLTSGLLLSLAFRRGRAFFVLLSFTLAYFAFVFFLERENAGLMSRTVYAAICVFVPLNIAIFTLLRERGALNVPGLRRLSLPLIEVGAVAAMVLADASEFTDVLYQPIIEHASLTGIQIPQWGIACTVAAVIIAATCAVLRGSVIDAAFAAAAASFALACNSLPWPGLFLWFCTIAGVIVAAAVVQDSHRMAFYDELTGLPGRRALNERLGSLDRSFTLAMVDIDHFKAFNDTWGHDVGDQVLKLVAAQLQRVGGGGTAYRYGGEEFTIVFPGRRAISVMQHLESLRKKIESYKLMLRENGRPRRPRSGKAMPTASGANKWISVTISTGVAERGDRLDVPEVVLAAADKALYRAKTDGRNRVSR